MIFLARATVAQPKPPLDVRSIGGGGGFAARWFRILQAVPLKHTVAALVGFVLITSVTAALTVASVLTRPGLDRRLHSLLVHWEGFMDQHRGIGLLPSLPLPPLPSGVVAPDLHAWLPPLVSALRRHGESALSILRVTLRSTLACVGPAAALSLALLVLYLKWSFELVWADHERIRARFPILETPAHDFDFEVRSWSSAAGQPVAEDLPNEAPLFDDASSPPAAPEEDLTEPLFATPATPNYYTPSAPVDVETLFNTAELPAETPAHETHEAGRFPSDLCLDLRGYSFQFINGYLYVPTLVTAILFS